MQSDPVYAKYYDEVLILLETGLRVSELCGLTPADLNFDKRFVNVDHRAFEKHRGRLLHRSAKDRQRLSPGAYERSGLQKHFRRVAQAKRTGKGVVGGRV